MTPILLFFGLALAGVGAVLLSQANLGVGLIGLGCLLGICARIVQAGAHQRANEQILRELLQQTRPAPSVPFVTSDPSTDGPLVVGGIVVRE